ncbi:hypothetical protein AA0111_g10629 [Alternaria arborescens]|uniref:hypothetical protein n=1 Tax=Alternaria arborescens TaxID=156630 RepID=UPI001074D550|nr:hypothetical protein AA0111_g10629 [Alternaria arborescens]RYO18735.1 hypothetical protein AA0111_g10629 [Alternaria arborescens]
MFRNSPTYPYPTLFSAAPDECFPQLLSCLPAKEELMEYLRAFQRRVYQVPAEMTINEVEDFLSDARKNSELYPTTLAFLFGLIALGTQHSTWDRGGGKWEAKFIEVETQKSKVYIAAAMQALRLASFTHKPSLSSIQTLLMIGSYLTNDGRMLDAYTLFGTTIRLAHSTGLHRHPKYLDPAPTNEKDCAVRQKVWWHMLHLDEHMSMTLGRPLGITGIGDNPWPVELTTDPVLLRFGEFVNHFTVLARQIMSCDRLTSVRINELTDALQRLLDTVPETLQFNDTWMYSETNLPDLYAIAIVYFCKAHTYIVLLNRQRFEKHTTQDTMPIGADSETTFQAVNRSFSSGFQPETWSTQATRRARALVLASSEALLTAFIFFYHRDPAALICWTLAQQAFNSSMILLLDAIECRTITVGAMKAEQAVVIFKDLYENNVHSLAGLAVEKISWGLQELHTAITKQPGGLLRKQGNAAAQEANKNEPTRILYRSDTVMGHTGTFPLEGPGQQALQDGVFVLETWDDLQTSTQFGEQQQGSSYLHMADQKETAPSKDDADSSRPAEIMQGLRRSTTLRSAPTRYATRSGDDHMQPHGYTAPASPSDFFILHGHGRKDTTNPHEWQTSQGDERTIPLHLHSQLQKVTASAEAENDMFWNQGWRFEGPDESQGHETPPSAWSHPRDESHGLHRHRSCPGIPPTNAQPPLLRPHYSLLSENDRSTARTSRNIPLRTTSSGDYTPFDAPQYPSYDSDPRPYNHFASSPAVPLPISSIAEAARVYAPTTHGMSQQGEQTHMRCPVVLHPSTVGPSSSRTPLASSRDMDDWNGYMGSEGFREGDVK